MSLCGCTTFLRFVCYMNVGEREKELGIDKYFLQLLDTDRGRVHEL